MCKFLWGGGVNARKIAWVKWEELCKQKKFGGLGVKNLEWVNFALLGKWLWRFLTDREALWARIVRARHGEVFWAEDGFRIERNRGKQAGWWGKVVGLSRGSGGKGLRDNLVISLGDGESISFWHHIWVGERKLSSMFPRLFRLSSNQEGKVKDMGRWELGSWVWELGWRRQLLERERDQIQILYSIINKVSLISGARDVWKWKAEPNGTYTTKSAYESFRSAEQREVHSNADCIWSFIWKVPAPFKALTTAWRVMKGKMATCDNLSKRNIIIDSREGKCVACKDHGETIEHFFFYCGETKEIWSEILRWIGVQTVLNKSPREHFLSFVNLGRKSDRKFLAAIWCAAVWCVWKWRNDGKFNNVKWDRTKVVGEIKSRMWCWKTAFGIKVKHVDYKSWFMAAEWPTDQREEGP